MLYFTDYNLNLNYSLLSKVREVVVNYLQIHRRFKTRRIRRPLVGGSRIKVLYLQL